MCMKHEPISKGKRRPVNLSLSEDAVTAARELGISISRTCDAALAVAVKLEKDRRWKEENRGAIEQWNHWIEKNGLPLESYRLF